MEEAKEKIKSLLVNRKQYAGWRVNPSFLKELSDKIPDNDFKPGMESIEQVLLALLGMEDEIDISD